MVRELDRVCSQNELSSQSVNKPVFFRTYASFTREEITFRVDVEPDDILLSYVNESVCKRLSDRLSLAFKLASQLSAHDPRTERVISPLKAYREFVIRRLDSASSETDSSRRVFKVNSEAITRIAEKFSHNSHRLTLAILIFLFHEASHISQGFTSYENVQRMKKTDMVLGRERLAELDLRSDFLAVHTLSLLLMLKQYSVYSIEKYTAWFYKIWCEICRSMVESFPPPGNRKDKQQRIFGFLLMANLVQDARERPSLSLEFKAEMYPSWSESLDHLSIYSDGDLFYPGKSVDPELMSQILNAISQGDYDFAASKIARLWGQLSRR